MRTIARIFGLGILGLAVLTSSWTASRALPRRATLLGGECNCLCYVDGGPSHSGLLGTITGLPNSFGSCSIYDSRTCNVHDPETDGIRSGSTQSCCQVQDNGTCRSSISGAIVQAPAGNLSATIATTTTTTPPPPTTTTTTTTPRTAPAQPAGTATRTNP